MFRLSLYQLRYPQGILYERSSWLVSAVAPTAQRKAPHPESAEIDNVYVKAAAERLRANPNDLDALEAVGAWLLARGQTEKALDCFHRITRADPKYPGIWRLKAQAFEAIGDRKSAEICRRRGADPRS